MIPNNDPIEPVILRKTLAWMVSLWWESRGQDHDRRCPLCGWLQPPIARLMTMPEKP